MARPSYVWDYDIDESTFREILAGKTTVGRLDRNWAATRLLEHAPYREIVRLLGFRALVEGWPAWRPTTVRLDPRIKNLRVTDETITAELVDGRTIGVPLAWSWRLSEATSQQRQHFEILGDGQGAHWPDLDEDISITGMLYGGPSRHPTRA